MSLQSKLLRLITISVIKLHTRERQVTIVVNSAYRLVFICSLPAFFVSYSGISLLILTFVGILFFLILYPHFFIPHFSIPEMARHIPYTSICYTYILYTRTFHPHICRIPEFSVPAVRNPQSTIR